MIDEKILLSKITDLKKNMKSENGDYLSGYFSALSTIEGMIAGYPKIGEWISFNNGLPEEDKDVLIYTPFEGIEIAYISDGCWYYTRGDEFMGTVENLKIVIWIPLPEVPEQYKE